MRKKMLALCMAASAVAMSFGGLAGAEEGKDTLTIAIAQNANVEDYDTNYLTQMIEKECNVDLKFILLPAASADAKSKLALMASSGEELPDVIRAFRTKRKAKAREKAGTAPAEAAAPAEGTAPAEAAADETPKGGA